MLLAGALYFSEYLQSISEQKLFQREKENLNVELYGRILLNMSINDWVIIIFHPTRIRNCIKIVTLFDHEV